MKILLVSLYFPPAGGAGAQRSLKFATHLPALGIETHVLAPDDPKGAHTDAGLQPPTHAWVHRARYLGPRGREPAEEPDVRQGLDRVSHQAELTLRRLLVPDENVSWNLTAIPAATRIVRREDIDVVVTTSPPSSVHLVGAAVKRLTRARWVADLRDSPPTNQTGGRALAGVVARSADAIVAASDAIAEEARGLEPKGRVATIANGCDFDDFAGLEYRPGERFRITYAGSFSGKPSPHAFLEALAGADLEVVARFVGDFRVADREWAEGLGLGDRLELHPHEPRRRSLELQRDSEALLLLAPGTKVFESIAAERPILAAAPLDGAAAELLRETGAVVVAPDDVEAIRAGLAELVGRWRAGRLNGTPLAEDLRDRLSREARSEELADLLRSLV